MKPTLRVIRGSKAGFPLMQGPCARNQGFGFDKPASALDDRVPMKLFLPISLLAAVFAFVSCAPSIDVTHTAAPNASFAGLKSFAWASGSRLNLIEPSADDAATEARIRAAIERELVAKGYTRGDASKADFLVGFAGVTNRGLKAQTVNEYYGYQRYRPSEGLPASTPGGAGRIELYQKQFTEGSLIVDVSERKTKDLLWRGVAKTTLLEDPTPERSQRRINSAVSKILAGFPPQ